MDKADGSKPTAAAHSNGPVQAAAPAPVALKPPPLPMSATQPANSAVKEVKQVFSWIGRIALSLIGLGLLANRWGCFDARSATNGQSINQPVVRKAGLRQSDLSLASSTLLGSWTSVHDLLPDSGQGWIGSSAVFHRANGKICLITNKHCLGLAELAQSAYSGAPAIGKYELIVQFPSGQQRTVSRFAYQAGGLDLAMLEINEAGLKEGRDYVLLPFVARDDLREGDEVVAVGTPRGLAGTQTFGRISAFRAQVAAGNERYRLLQIDAPINHGNSGGPLFVKRGDAYHWIGLNTSGYDDANSLGFAIAIDVFFSTKFCWFDANPAGAAKAVNQFYSHQ